MLVLYREKDLDEAYRIDCRARTKDNVPWLKREEFRDIYEALLDMHFTKSVEKKVKKTETDVSEWVIETVNKALQNTIDFEPEK
tara:strand:+ start:597 stop:848 length:252 start_codon:yes stop_codon:yes gene_type:complete